MIQRSFHIKDYTSEKFNAVLREVAGIPEYDSAAQVLLLMIDQNWDTSIMKEKIRLVKATLPKAEIVGATHYDNMIDTGYNAPNNCILSFMMFENPAFSIHRLHLNGLRDVQIGEAAGDIIRACDSPKCLMTLFASMPRDIGIILDTAERDNPDIPIFGAQAGVQQLFTETPDSSFVYDAFGIYNETLLMVLFYGESLHVKPSYNFGWTQVGRTMTITGLRSPYVVSEIDGRPAAEMYERYLGIPWHSVRLAVENISEFPLVATHPTDAGGMMPMGRIPFAWTDDGELLFAVSMHEGEKIRLTYGLPQQIFGTVENDALSLHDFSPQALLMVICMNRMIFLREHEHIETDYYRTIVPEAAFMHGNSEIFRYNGAGGEMHSALIAIGFREGPAEEIMPVMYEPEVPEAEANDVIPLELRLMAFMKAVTSDLEGTTAELLQLKDNLEEEVERKTLENKNLSLHIVQTLADAIDAKDTYTNGHSGRVAKYSREIARRFGYSEKAQDEIYIMGLLHDVGKIGVPDAVINKPGKLTDEEFDAIRNHPVMGARILGNIKEMPQLVTGARWHHERIDGRGYPDKLAGDDIPEEARIIAVADAYDAMTSNRSYRRGMEQSRVREQIEKGRGSQFDERFADIMLQMIDEDTDYQMREI